tara:strand:- start:2257 stop:3480 length:1224 start_codon:yes stop_codon:yes gene_type:complete
MDLFKLIYVTPPKAQSFDTSSNKSHTCDQKEIPVFLIPGINGNGSELEQLALALREKRSDTAPMYVYEEPTNDYGLPQTSSLEAHAKSIALEILEKTNYSPLPKIIAGFSFGGILAAEVARELQKMHYDPQLYVIDEPAKSLIRERADSANTESKSYKSFIADLLKVADYAARLSGLKSLESLNLKIDTSTLTYLKKEGRINSFFNSLIRQQDTIPDALAATKFVRFLQIAKRNLTYTVSKDSNPDIKLASMHLILTLETALKYGANNDNANSFTGAWEQYCKEVTLLKPADNDNKLKVLSHMDLLREGNAELVATLIADSLEHNLTPKKLRERQLEAIDVSFNMMQSNSTEEPNLPALSKEPSTFFHPTPTKAPLRSTKSYDGLSSLEQTPSNLIDRPSSPLIKAN